MNRILGLILAVAVAGVLAAASQAGNRSPQHYPRYGVTIHVKECSAYTGLAGQFCTIRLVEPEGDQGRLEGRLCVGGRWFLARQ